MTLNLTVTIMKIQISRRALIAGALATLVTVSLPTMGARPAMAHEANCPYCDMPVTQDTATQDNEVALKYGRKRIEYKCVYCALAEAKTEYPNGDLSITAPSETKGQPVVLKRTGGKWSMTPETAAFVTPAKVKHKVCQDQARAFNTEAAAKAFAAKNGGSVMTLEQLNDFVK